MRNIDYDASSDHLAGQRCTGSSWNKRCSMLAREPNQFTNIGLGLGQRDGLRHFAIDGRTGRIKRPHGGVEMEIAFELSSQALQLGGARSRHSHIHTLPGLVSRLESKATKKDLSSTIEKTLLINFKHAWRSKSGKR